MTKKQLELQDIVVAILCGFVGMGVGALGGGVLAHELSKSTTPTGSGAAFESGFVTGAALGGLLGIAGFVLFRRRRGAHREPPKLALDDAARQFKTRMTVRHAGFGSIAVAFVYMQASGKQLLSSGTFGFVVLLLAGALAYAFASRCPACKRFFDTRTVRERKCTTCGQSFEGAL